MNTEDIVAGARTVTNLAVQFEELKQTMQRLLDSFRGQQRGYVTPSEDEEIRHLLVSYWQSRNALIELVTSYHRSLEACTADRQRVFLIAYTGALVLVDAARFIREKLHDRPIIREKLNEPEPHFGIAAGTYNCIQKSLTSPVHAWHLYHAGRYFAQHQAELQALRDDALFAALVDVVTRLSSRVQPNLSEYALARADVRAQEIVVSVRRDLLGAALYGLQKLVSWLLSDAYTLAGHHPLLPDDTQAALKSVLQPGDVLITRKEHALTNYFLPGYWPHAALYLGDSNEMNQLGLADHTHLKPRWARFLECDKAEPRRVLEALKDGVWIRSLMSPFTSDSLAVIRPRIPRDAVASALARGLFHDGKPYDFDFDFTRSDRLVCTEVVYRSYEGVGGIQFQLTRRTGRMTLAAEDLLQMALDKAHFEVVAVHAPPYTTRIVFDDEAAGVIRQTKGIA